MNDVEFCADVIRKHADVYGETDIVYAVQGQIKRSRYVDGFVPLLRDVYDLSVTSIFVDDDVISQYTLERNGREMFETTTAGVHRGEAVTMHEDAVDVLKMIKEEDLSGYM